LLLQGKDDIFEKITKYDLCSLPEGGAKMEAGESPARFRHCKGGAAFEIPLKCRRIFWEGERLRRDPSQETCINWGKVPAARNCGENEKQ